MKSLAQSLAQNKIMKGRYNYDIKNLPQSMGVCGVSLTMYICPK